jgi:hypothetical protein
MKSIVICFVVLFLSACTQKSYTLNPQSHFDYPNSNIKPIASTSGTVSEISFSFSPPNLSGELERIAIEDALKKQAGADILINFIGEQKTTQILILPIFSITYTVRGTAAKMEVGKQYLN